VNDALLNISSAAAVFSMDHRWIRSRLSTLQTFPGEKFLAIHDRHSDLMRIPGATYLTRSRSEGLSDDPSTVHLGGCSGYGALNVAVLLGARRITLYGFDLTPGRAWASEHPEQRVMYRAWARMFRSTLPFLEDRGIIVVNASLDSAIDAFPKLVSSLQGNHG
jgi:hypothetical protein